MKIKDGIKAGIGFTIGMTLTGATIKWFFNKNEDFLRKVANDEEFMDGIKTRNPDLYEKLQKYIKHD